MKQWKRWFKYMAVILVLLVVFLRSEVQEISAVQDVAGISIDPGEDGNYLFGLELAVPEKGGSFTVNSKLMTVPAKTLSQALIKAGLRNEYPVVLTHGSLVVVHADLVGTDLSNISEMLLFQWSGQTETFVAVADGCNAREILKQDEKENLRAGLLSAQVKRADDNGILHTARMMEFVSGYLQGEGCSLPLVTLSNEGYRISGSIRIQKAVGQNEKER